MGFIAPFLCVYMCVCVFEHMWVHMCVGVHAHVCMCVHGGQRLMFDFFLNYHLPDVPR